MKSFLDKPGRVLLLGPQISCSLMDLISLQLELCFPPMSPQVSCPFILKEMNNNIQCAISKHVVSHTVSIYLLMKPSGEADI